MSASQTQTSALICWARILPATLGVFSMLWIMDSSSWTFLTLAPIWLPHWPIWMCTISRILALCPRIRPAWSESPVWESCWSLPQALHNSGHRSDRTHWPGCLPQWPKGVSSLEAQPLAPLCSVILGEGEFFLSQHGILPNHFLEFKTKGCCCVRCLQDWHQASVLHGGVWAPAPGPQLVRLLAHRGDQDHLQRPFPPKPVVLSEIL